MVDESSAWAAFASIIPIRTPGESFEFAAQRINDFFDLVSIFDEELKQLVKDKLDNTKLDFLFIDGDHTYEGVKQDFEMYKEFVKPGGWIGFHDIKDTEFHRNADCRVDILWNEIEGEKIEFLDNSSSYGGIGFIKVQ